jgi:WD40 repeat protein/predicted Ser/Thr protein kinase
MTEDRRARLWALFDQAADLPPQEQCALLDAACRDDAPLRAEVERLLTDDARLRADGGASAFLDSPLSRLATLAIRAPRAAVTAALPLRIGRYRILRLLGEGGMGVVYEAEQDNPRRPVALKVIRPGLLAPTLLKRFAQEAQILGRLHHPGIAQIYEAGVAEDGQPFFALEFIHGLPLDEYARRHSLDPAARLDLLARVCDAVQHAHEQGVIHRDLKPANILVDESGQPKVLDFGVARASAADVLSSTEQTRTGQLLGTLSYMSPEQVAADPATLDARSDVYTLGVMLYELLAGRLPYPVEHLPLPEAARVIREQEPARLGVLEPQLRGDVETIVAKALEKEPGRRYASAAELAADLRRHLRNEPIQARPASALYQLGKFARRNKTLVGGVAAVMLALIAGLIGTTLFAMREARQRDQAEHNATVANEQKARADEEKKAALRHAYRASLAAAAGALQGDDVADAARHLDDKMTEELRDWEWRHLHSRLDDRSSRIPIEPGASCFLLPGPEGIQVAQLVPKTHLCLADLDGKRPRTISLDGNLARATDVLQSKDGLRFVEWAKDKTLSLWDETGALRLRITPGKDVECGSPSLVRLSPDGSRLAVPLIKRRRWGFALYETTSGKLTAECLDHEWLVRALTFSPDGTRIASAGSDNVACVWDTATGRKVATCRGHTLKIRGAAFSPDGARLATTSADGTVRQWNPATGLEVEPPYDRHGSEVYSAAYSPDGVWLATGGADRTIRCWRATGREEAGVLHGHTGTVSALAFTPDGRQVASVSQGVERDFRGDETVGVWDVDFRARLPVLRGHTSYVYAVAYSPDGRWLASGSYDTTIRIWDASTGELCATLIQPDIVRTLAFGPDGQWLVTGDRLEDRLRIWDVAMGRVRREIRGPRKGVRYLAVSPDGSRIASTVWVADPVPGDSLPAQEHYLSIWDASSGEELFSAKGFALAYSPDGSWLATTSADVKGVLLMDARTHRVVKHLTGHKGEIKWAAFSPDSRRLASCSLDGTVRLWDVGSGACQVLSGHTDEVFAVAFHPDGTRLASGGRDGSIWLWDTASGQDVARLRGHTSFVQSLAFSPDGKTLASGSGDQTIRLWDTEPLRVRHRARREADALRPDAERLVERLLQEKKAPSEIVATLRDDARLSEPLRQAALTALRRAMMRDAH